MQSVFPRRRLTRPASPSPKDDGFGKSGRRALWIDDLDVHADLERARGRYGRSVGQQNLQWPGQTVFLGSGPTSGSALEPMSDGELATLWLYAHGDTLTPLATLEVHGQH